MNKKVRFTNLIKISSLFHSDVREEMQASGIPPKLPDVFVGPMLIIWRVKKRQYEKFF